MIERLSMLPRTRLVGVDLATNTVILTAQARLFRVRAIMDTIDKLDWRTYGIRVFGSVNTGATWTFLGGGRHGRLGPRPNKKTGAMEDRPVCLSIYARTRFPSGMWVRARIDLSDEMPVAVDLETE